jgi:phospholipid/cholesterol/gamma-HCH transport system substrate-binding protein
METKSKKRAVIVGVFIFIGVVIFTLTILMLGGQRKTFTRSIEVKAVFSDVNGLKKGSSIWFSGVKIGTVKRILFSGTSKVEVDMNIEESSHEYIRKDAKAKISSDGLIGNKIILLYEGSPKYPAIESGDMLTVDEVESTDEMMKTLQENNRNLVQITNDFKIVSQRLRDGEGTLGRLSADETLVTNLESALLSIKKTSVSLEQITKDVSGFTSKLNNKGSLTDNLVNDTIVFNRLRASAIKLEAITASANDLIHEIHTKVKDPKTPVGLLLSDQETATTIKSALKNLESGSKKLDEDLEALQHNFLFRRYFKKHPKTQNQ